ncbi:hypothetical protein FO488_17270 [Geobacter sp. FeAm09]|uniref:GspE/PulE/PilB domain-containing protein n=1 Tax=Geobacter sp. FeAm09 TaxID=2597769 RepID=UPI0011ED882B|nr:hypothetical protein [Geobacter sp. FeAm09]QEM69729.1 hypothetical protein FO488_17270 [Geobacter sp. FeAm09]
MTELVKKGSLGHILSSSRIISESDIISALEEQKRSGTRFGEALVHLGVVTQEDIDWALSNQLDLPYIRLKKEMIDPEAVALVPAEVARAYNLIPLICAGGELSVAVADPLNRAAVEAVEARTGLRVNLSVALIREIRQMIDAWYGPAGQERLGFSSAAFSGKALEAINGDVGGDTLLNYLLVFIVQNRLSSLSLQPLGDEVAITGKRGGSPAPSAPWRPTTTPTLSSGCAGTPLSAPWPSAAPPACSPLPTKPAPWPFRWRSCRGWGATT